MTSVGPALDPRSSPAEVEVDAASGRRYEPIRLLGRGGMGAVYEAVDRRSGRRVAMKKILAPDARQQLRFKREFRMMADLHHPGLVRLFDLGFEDGAWYFTMELIDGAGWLAACGGEGDASDETTLDPEPSGPAPAEPLLGDLAPDRSAPGRAALDRSAPGRAALDPPTLDRSALDRSALDRSALDPPAPDRSALDPPAPDPPAPDPPAPDPPAPDPPARAEIDARSSAPRSPGARRLDLATLRDPLEQLLAALEFLHAQGIVHRDLKPSNVLVDRQGRVKVLDFGLASPWGPTIDAAPPISRTGVALGTVAYMAPEQLLGQPVTDKADLYAIGCMLFQAITGRLPQSGPPAAIVQARLHQPPPRLDRYVAGAPRALVEVVAALLDRDPRGRPTIDAIREAFALDRPVVDAAEARVTGSTGARDLPFVGRQPELTHLEAILGRALAGELCFQLVEGASGIGKSALARQLVRRASEAGALCFVGRCYEREHLPFVAFDRAIDALTLTLSRWPADALASIQGPLQAASTIFPALELLIDETRPSPVPSPTRARGERLRAAFDGLWAVLERCQARAPVVIVLDDLQWSDDESVALLADLLARPAARLLLLGLSRPPADADPPAARRLRALARDRGATPTLELHALEPGDRAALIELAGRDRLGPAILGGLASRAEGNPLLDLQLVDHLALLDSSDRGECLRSLDSGGGVIEALVDRLEAPARRLLELAATAGGDVDEALLRAASELDADAFDRALADLVAARMVRVTDDDALALGEATRDGPDKRRLDVFHDRIRETVYDALDPVPRARLHRALASALEARDDGGRDVEALLRHYAAAGEAARARALALEASARAEAQLAFRRAATLLGFALGAEPCARDPDEAERWEHLGELYAYSAQLDPSIDAYRRALALREGAEAPGDRRARLRLHGRIGETLIMAGLVRDGRASFDRGLAMIDLRPGRPAILLRLRLALWWITALPARWVQRPSTPAVQEEIHFLGLATRIMGPLWPALTAELALRGTVMGLRVGDQRFLQRLLATQVLGLILQGRTTPRALARAARDLDASEALALRLELPLGLEVVMMHRSLHAMATDVGRAQRLIDEALAAIARCGMREGFDGAIARALRILILYRRGAYDLALAAIRDERDEALSLLNVPVTLFYEVLIHAHRGRVDLGARAMERLGECFAAYPRCGLTTRADVARITLRVAEGRYAAALAESAACERAWAEHGAAPKGDFAGLWRAAAIEAALGCLRVGAEDVPKDMVQRTYAHARWLITRGTLDHACMGHRALALLAAREGRARAAARALDRALARSAINTSPHRRWLCLEAAAELGRRTVDLVSEARALAAEHGFVHPPGWQGAVGR